MKTISLPYRSARVLQPSESTILLIDCLPSSNGRRVFVPGCGAGMIPITLAANGARVTTCDINPFAVELSMRNAGALRVDLEIVHGSYSDVMPPSEGWDLIAANPPQQPTRNEHIHLDHWEDQAHMGGRNGISVIAGLLRYFARSHAPNGEAYLAILSFLIDHPWMNVASIEGLIFSQVAAVNHKKGKVTSLGMDKNPDLYNPKTLEQENYEIRIFRFIGGGSDDGAASPD